MDPKRFKDKSYYRQAYDLTNRLAVALDNSKGREHITQNKLFYKLFYHWGNEPEFLLLLAKCLKNNSSRRQNES